jgi:hypothetical protein
MNEKSAQTLMMAGILIALFGVFVVNNGILKQDLVNRSFGIGMASLGSVMYLAGMFYTSNNVIVKVISILGLLATIIIYGGLFWMVFYT